MNIKNGLCLHIMLFGTFNENKYFLGDYKDSFNLIGFNSNIIAHAPSGIAAFIAQLKNKSYFIDPQTYAFQQPIRTIMRKKENTWVLKTSIKKLSELYGSIIKEKAGKVQIEAGSLSNGMINEICNNVLLFEMNKIQESTENLDVKKFLEFSDIELRPEFLVAPYFYLEPDNLENELEDNILFIKESKEIIDKNVLFNSKPIFAEIVIDKEVLFDSYKCEEVIKKYKNCIADGFLLWIDDFLEVSVSKSALMKYMKFLIELNECRKPIISLHGSFFSIVLSGEKELLAGVGHGIEYGEYRPVIPVGGGVPLAKFYFPKFYKRVDYSPDAENILLEIRWEKDRDTYLNNVCNCKTCQEIIKHNVQNSFAEYGETKISEKNGKSYPVANAMNKSRKHYLNKKICEYDFCSSSKISNIIDKLNESKQIADNIKSHSFNHLGKWIELLK